MASIPLIPKLSGIARIRARNVLNFSGQADFFDEPLLPVELSAKKERTKHSGTHGYGNELSIFPNPAKEFIELKYKCNQAKSIAVTVFDLYGHVIFTHDYAGSEGVHSIEVRNWANGSYFIRIIADNGYQESKNITILR